MKDHVAPLNTNKPGILKPQHLQKPRVKVSRAAAAPGGTAAPAAKPSTPAPGPAPRA